MPAVPVTVAIPAGLATGVTVLALAATLRSLGRLALFALLARAALRDSGEVSGPAVAAARDHRLAVLQAVLAALRHCGCRGCRACAGGEPGPAGEGHTGFHNPNILV